MSLLLKNSLDIDWIIQNLKEIQGRGKPGIIRGPGSVKELVAMFSHTFRQKPRHGRVFIMSLELAVDW